MRNNKMFIGVDEVADNLSISKSAAYKIVRELNDELKSKGFVTIAGRVSRKYFTERFYGVEAEV